MSDIFDPRFVMGQAYDLDEFVFRLEAIQAGLGLNETRFRDILQKNIDWAKQHPANTRFVWNIHKDGIAYPDAIVEASLPTSDLDG